MLVASPIGHFHSVWPIDANHQDCNKRDVRQMPTHCRATSLPAASTCCVNSILHDCGMCVLLHLPELPNDQNKMEDDTENGFECPLPRPRDVTCMDTEHTCLAAIPRYFIMEIHAPDNAPHLFPSELHPALPHLLHICPLPPPRHRR